MVENPMCHTHQLELVEDPADGTLYCERCVDENENDEIPVGQWLAENVPAEELSEDDKIIADEWIRNNPPQPSIPAPLSWSGFRVHPHQARIVRTELQAYHVVLPSIHVQWQVLNTPVPLMHYTPRLPTGEATTDINPSTVARGLILAGYTDEQVQVYLVHMFTGK